jgi:hypothetical protein
MDKSPIHNDDDGTNGIVFVALPVLSIGELKTGLSIQLRYTSFNIKLGKVYILDCEDEDFGTESWNPESASMLIEARAFLCKFKETKFVR